MHWCREYCSGRDLGGRNHSNVANKESTTGLLQKASLLSSGAQPFPKASKSSRIRYRNDLVNTAAKKYIMKGMIVSPEVMGSVGLAHGREFRDPFSCNWQRARSKIFRAKFPYFSIVEFRSYNFFFVVDSVLFIIDCFGDPWIPTHQMPVPFSHCDENLCHTGCPEEVQNWGNWNGWKGTIDKIVCQLIKGFIWHIRNFKSGAYENKLIEWKIWCFHYKHDRVLLPHLLSSPCCLVCSL